MLVAPSLAISPTLYSKINYDPVKDFAPISLVATVPNVMITQPSLPAENLQEFIAYARSRPGALNFGSGGAGTSNHLAGELFNIVAGTKLVHVPYKGVNLAMQDVLAGNVHLVFIGIPAAAPHIKAGKLRALALVAPQRSGALPDVPTVAEAGLRDFEVTTWYGVLAPGRHSEKDRRPTQRRAGEDHALPGAQGKARRHRHRAPHQHAGRVRRLHQARDRQVGRRDPQVGSEGRLGSISGSCPAACVG